MKPEFQQDANWNLALTALPILEAPSFRAGSWRSEPGTFPFYAFDSGAMQVLKILRESGVIRPFDWGRLAIDCRTAVSRPQSAWTCPIVNAGETTDPSRSEGPIL